LRVKFSWDFNDNLRSAAAGSDTYGFIVKIDGTILFNIAGPFGSGSAITGSAVRTLPAGSTKYSIELDIDASSVGAGSEIIANIPAGTSLDVEARDIRITASPEPGTMSLAASALAGLLWWRRRRKASLNILK
jgi:MYXO-CTERM domain-containing protein